MAEMAATQRGAKDVHVRVFHTMLAKQLYEHDGGLALDATCLQRAVLPEGFSGEERHGGIAEEPAGGETKRAEHAPRLQFQYRINDKFVALDERKHRLESARDDDKTLGSCATYSCTLPLKVATIFQTYPFAVRFASVKIELTSTMARVHGAEVTLRPNIVRDKRAPGSSMVTIKDASTLDALVRYSLVTTAPVVHGKREHKGRGAGEVRYTPILHAGFYILEPAGKGVIYTFAPVALILTFLGTLTNEAVQEFRSHLAILAIALVVALVQGNVNTGAVASSRVSSFDAFVLLLFASVGICVVAQDSLWMRQLGIGVGWSSFLIPLVGCVRYNACLASIRGASAHLEFSRSDGKGTTTGAGKEKGEDFDVGSLELVPEEHTVANAPGRLFATKPKPAAPRGVVVPAMH